MGIYQSCYDLVAQYIYGGVQLTSDMSLVATIIATMASVGIFALPFVVVAFVIKLVIGGWR